MPFHRKSIQTLFSCSTLLFSNVHRHRVYPLAWRSISTAAIREYDYAFAFDIDGVLIKGKYVLPQTKRVLRLLNGENPKNCAIPFILITNGGGVNEEEKAYELTKKFESPISPNQLVLSHSPMKSLATHYRDKAVLVIGGAGIACREVAEKYGFKKVILPNDVIAWDPSIWPFKKLSEQEKMESKKYDFAKVPIEAVMVFHDSRDWGRDIQIAMDVFRSHNGLLGTLRHDFLNQEIPIFFSNPDIIWSNNFPTPRLAQGSFRIALEEVYSQMTGNELKYTTFGKPDRKTYEFAELQLNKWAEQLGMCKPKRVYAVGDNPAGDIAGANAYGWTSILVRTGVFSKGENDEKFPANKVVEDVEEAVRWTMEKEEG